MTTTMPNETFWLEALRRPETYALVVAVLGLVGSYQVIWALIKIIKNRESNYTSVLSQVEKVAKCQGQLLRATGSIYSQLLELKNRTNH